MLKLNSLLSATDSGPDQLLINPNSKLNGLIPSNSFVVSRTADGAPLSFYGDDAWDLATYKRTPIGTGKINFSSWVGAKNRATEENILIFKWLIIIVTYMPGVDERRSHITVGSIVGYANMLRAILKVVEDEETKLLEVLESEKLIAQYVTKIDAKHLKLLSALLNRIMKLGEEKTGIKPVGRKLIASIRSLAREADSNYRQTAVIPSRIYSEVINSLISNISDIVTYQDKLLSFLDNTLRNRCFGRESSLQRKYLPTYGRREYYPSFKEAAATYGLSNLFKVYNVTSVLNLCSFIKVIQKQVKLLIHALSGMRRSEVYSLRYDCLVTDYSLSPEITYLVGHTTKFTSKPKLVRWIVSNQVIEGVELCKKIADVAVKALGGTSDDSRRSLFTNITPSTFSRGEYDPVAISNLENSNFWKSEAWESIFKPIKINSQDRREMEFLMYGSVTLSDKAFQVGENWKLKTHQFRRSLAFYVAQSGLVSLPSLKHQLKHLTREMAIYYMQGAGSQLSFFMENDETHFIAELKKIKPMADSLAYIKEILCSDEQLYGAAGRHINRYEKPNNSNVQTIDILERQSIQNRFERGEIAYSETPLGACLSSKPCDKKALRAVSACIDCEKAVIKKEELGKTITQMEKFLSTLDTTSIEYKFEFSQLDDLKRMARQIGGCDE
jgi:integrase|tara:strand:+ start:64604 stop:66613 length:2010 start_codon:yes stop_codon:yes gene_type:complete